MGPPVTLERYTEPVEEDQTHEERLRSKQELGQTYGVLWQLQHGMDDRRLEYLDPL